MKNVYFLSDAHLGSRAIEHGRTQERRLVNFLDSIKHKAAAVYLLGDMFDFWYEFRTVVQMCIRDSNTTTAIIARMFIQKYLFCRKEKNSFIVIITTI